VTESDQITSTRSYSVSHQLSHHKSSESFIIGLCSFLESDGRELTISS